jgi:hypothetical protein
MNNIEQTDDGTIFAVSYQDNGHFYVNVIDNKGEEFDTLDVSALLKLDTQSKPITGFWEPLMTSVFIPGSEDKKMDLFISAYHRIQKRSYHFTYSYLKKKSLCKPIVMEV